MSIESVIKTGLNWLTGGVFDKVSNVINKMNASDEDKLEAHRSVLEIMQEADAKGQEEVTKRWQADMNSDSPLSKKVRPGVIIYLTFVFSILAVFDGNVSDFSVKEYYITILQTLLIAVYSAYFVGRSWEKGRNLKGKK